MSLILFEMLEVALRPALLVLLFLGLALTVDGVASLDVGEGRIKVMLYSRDDTSEKCQTFLVEAHELLRETVDLDISRRPWTQSELVVQMIQDEADLGILCGDDGWRISVTGRSDLEHQRLVRAAQLAAITLSRHEPWFIKVYRELFRGDKDVAQLPTDWPTAVNISNPATSPGSHARIFLPKIIAMLCHFVAFGFACRSVARDIAGNTLSTIVAASHGHWWPTILARATVASLLALSVLSFLLAISANRHGFTITAPDLTTIAIQALSLTAGALLGLTASLALRSEIRIIMMALVYFVVSFLFSGLISAFDPERFFFYSLSKALPAGYAMDSLTNFMFHGMSSVSDAGGLQNLAAANIAIVTLLLIVASRLRRTF